MKKSLLQIPILLTIQHSNLLHELLDNSNSTETYINNTLFWFKPDWWLTLFALLPKVVRWKRSSFLMCSCFQLIKICLIHATTVTLASIFNGISLFYCIEDGATTGWYSSKRFRQLYREAMKNYFILIPAWKPGKFSLPVSSSCGLSIHATSSYLQILFYIQAVLVGNNCLLMAKDIIIDDNFSIIPYTIMHLVQYTIMLLVQYTLNLVKLFLKLVKNEVFQILHRY